MSLIISRTKSNTLAIFNQNLQKKNDDNSIFLNEIEYLQPELDFISSHFYEIEPKQIQLLNPQLFEEIIKSDKLKIRDEDSLLEVIISFYTNDPSLAYLFEYIDFLSVSTEKVQHFYDVFDINDLNTHIWASIIQRTLSSKANQDELNKKQERYTKEKVRGIALLRERGEFNGIIKYWTDKTGGNVYDNNTIDMKYTGYFSHPKYALDFNDEYFYQPNSTTDCWFAIDFTNMKVKITNYSIKSWKGASYQPKNWDIEVSNDGVSWTKIDEQKNCSKLRGQLISATFDVKPNDYSRYIRYHQTGEAWGNGYLDLNYIEFYGYLLSE